MFGVLDHHLSVRSEEAEENSLGRAHEGVLGRTCVKVLLEVSSQVLDFGAALVTQHESGAEHHATGVECVLILGCVTIKAHQDVLVA